MLWEAEGPVEDAVNKVEWDFLDLLTVEHDKVILADEQRVLSQDHQTLLLIVPVVHPGEEDNTVSVAFCVPVCFCVGTR